AAQRGSLALGRLRLPALADQLLDGGHASPTENDRSVDVFTRMACKNVHRSVSKLTGGLLRAGEEAGLVVADAGRGVLAVAAGADVGQPGGQVLVGVGGVVRQRFVVRRLEVETPVPGHARARRDQLADDDVLLEAE